MGPIIQTWQHLSWSWSYLLKCWLTLLTWYHLIPFGANLMSYPSSKSFMKMWKSTEPKDHWCISLHASLHIDWRLHIEWGLSASYKSIGLWCYLSFFLFYQEVDCGLLCQMPYQNQVYTMSTQNRTSTDLGRLLLHLQPPALAHLQPAFPLSWFSTGHSPLVLHPCQLVQSIWPRPSAAQEK